MSYIYKRGEVYWFQAKIDGRTYRESLHTKSISIARKEAPKRVEKLKGEIYRGDLKISWSQAVIEWSDHIEKQVGGNSAKRYAVSLKQCEPYLKPFNVQNINGKIITDLMTGRAKDGATNATIRRDLTAISSVLEYAIGREWIETNPTLTKRRLVRERREPIVLPQHDAIRAYVEAADPHLGALIMGAWLTGCRQDELASATWKSFNEAAGTLEVIGKGRKRRVIKLYPEAHALIAKLPRLTDFIFGNEKGRFKEPATLFTHLRRAVMHKASKEGRTVQRFRFHDLRHLFAVEALQGGRMGIYELSRHLGHTSVKTTEIYLAFLTPEEATRAGQAGAQFGAQSASTPLQISMF